MLLLVPKGLVGSAASSESGIICLMVSGSRPNKESRGRLLSESGSMARMESGKFGTLFVSRLSGGMPANSPASGKGKPPVPDC